MCPTCLVRHIAPLAVMPFARFGSRSFTRPAALDSARRWRSSPRSCGHSWRGRPRRPLSCAVRAVAQATAALPHCVRHSAPPPSRSLPPLAFCRGTRPIHAARFRPERKIAGSGTRRDDGAGERSQSARQMGPLAVEDQPNPVQHHRALLFRRPDAHEAHGWPRHRLADRLGIGRVVLAPLYVRLHILRWHQLADHRRTIITPCTETRSSRYPNRSS